MKTIIINENNVEKITAVLADVQKRSKVRTIDTSDIYNTVDRVNGHLAIPKKYMEGVMIHCDLNAQDFPNAYKYRPESTHFTATFKGGKWRLTGVYRDTTERTNKVKITLTGEAKEKILDNITVIK